MLPVSASSSMVGCPLLRRPGFRDDSTGPDRESRTRVAEGHTVEPVRSERNIVGPRGTPVGGSRDQALGAQDGSGAGRREDEVLHPGLVVLQQRETLPEHLVGEGRLEKRAAETEASSFFWMGGSKAVSNRLRRSK